MQKDEWIALVIGGGGFIWAYTTQYQQNNLFFGYPATMWLVLPVVLGVLYWKRNDFMKGTAKRNEPEHPNVVVDRLKSEEGDRFRELFDILTFTKYSYPKLFKSGVYRITMEDSINKKRYLAVSAERGSSSPFLSVYKYGDWLEHGFSSEKEYLNQMLPKDKPTVLDVMEELPEGEKGSALQYFKDGVDTK